MKAEINYFSKQIDKYFEMTRSLRTPSSNDFCKSWQSSDSMLATLYMTMQKKISKNINMGFGIGSAAKSNTDPLLKTCCTCPGGISFNEKNAFRQNFANYMKMWNESAKRYLESETETPQSITRQNKSQKMKKKYA